MSNQQARVDAIKEELKQDNKAQLEQLGMIVRLTDLPEWKMFMQFVENQKKLKYKVVNSPILTEEDVRLHNATIGELIGIEWVTNMPVELKEKYNSLVEQMKMKEREERANARR